MDRPEPFQVSTWERAEENAARWLRFWGFADARVTNPGADGGVDVVSSGVIAQVKFKAVQVGAPEVQQLAGAGFAHPNTQLCFFTGTGYSAQAFQAAELANVSLFTYQLDGAVTAVNGHARALSRPQSDIPSATASTTVAGQSWTQQGSGFVDRMQRTNPKVYERASRTIDSIKWWLAAAMAATFCVVPPLVLFDELVGRGSKDGPTGDPTLAIVVFVVISSISGFITWRFVRRAIRTWSGAEPL